MRGRGWVSVIPVGPGHGIVLGAEEHSHGHQWLRLPEIPDVFVVLPMYGEEDANRTLVGELRRTLEQDWQPVFPAFGVLSDGLWLLHAASAGKEVRQPRRTEYAAIGAAIPYDVSPGTYRVEERSLTVPSQPDESMFVLCRLRPAQA